MSLTQPYTTAIHTVCPGDSLITRLSFALWLVDSFTGKQAAGPVEVSIPGKSVKAYRNTDGYFIFTDLNSGNYIAVIESEFYAPQEKQINTAVLDIKNPVVTIQITPNPAYPFPDNATLTRGTVYGIVGPVENASVKALSKPYESVTDKRGEFVIYFKNFKQEQIQLIIEKGGDTKTVPVEIIEGKTVSAGTISFP